MNSESIIQPSIYSNDFFMYDVKSMCVWLEEQAFYLPYSDPKISLRLVWVLFYILQFTDTLRLIFVLLWLFTCTLAFD